MRQPVERQLELKKMFPSEAVMTETWNTADLPVSVYNNCYTTVSTYVQSMGSIIEMIQSDVYRDFIVELVTIGETFGFDSEEYREQKQDLVCFSVYGQYYSIKRQAYDPETKKPNIQIYNKIGHGDIDKLEIQQAKEIRDLLKKSKYIAWCYLSPSQRGVKFGVRTDATTDNHLDYFEQIQQHFSEYLELPIEYFDFKVKDLSRLCFLSHDPDAYLNPHPDPFPFKEAEQAEVKGRVIFDAEQVQESKKDYPDETNWEEVLQHVPGYEDRDTWVEVGMALKAELGDAGFPLWENWSKQSAKWNNENNPQRRWNKFEPSRITGATLIFRAKENGWEPRQQRAKSAIQQSKGRAAPVEVQQGNLHYQINKQGQQVLIPNLHNCRELIQQQRLSVWYDEFLRQIQTEDFDGEIIQWDDSRTLELTVQMQSLEGMRRLGRDIVDQAIHLVAYRNVRNSLQDWLSALQWDGTERLDTWLARYCGAEVDEYTTDVGKCWLLAAVARAYEPGTKFDHMLVLEGPQGIGKSSIFEILAGGYFSELNKFDGKEPAEKLAGRWLIEVGELAGLRKSDVETVKSFLTCRVDRYRPAYGRYVIDVPRTCVFGGTTNADQYLNDATGNRRFWPVRCGQVDLTLLREERDLLLAEAVRRYQQGETFLLGESARKTVLMLQEDRDQDDAWMGPISRWLEKRHAATMEELFTDALDFEHKNQWKRADEVRIGNIMKKLNWKRYRVRNDGRLVYEYRPEK